MDLNKPRLLLLCCVLASAVATSSGQNDAIERPTSEPYKGDLAIFEDPARAKNLQIDRVLDLLGIRRGSRVADVGAGSGWFTVRAARRVAKDGVVYAVEINPDYVHYIEARAKKAKLANVRTVLGKPDDPLLSPASVDAVLLLKTYHEVAQPIALLRHVRAAMRPGAKLGIIDKNGKGDDHGLDANLVIKEAAQAGFKLVAQYDFVKADKLDYFVIFAPNE
ncbi:MAG: methyltransferase domain-containing protein [Verrucomicrobiota bacterium]|nr:methyltransferase domain-containing protein [Verrucomicrobiota bacterium]